MCDRCDELEDEVDYLRLRLGERLDADILRAVRETWGLSAMLGRLVVLLYQARTVVSVGELEDGIKRDAAFDYADTSNVIAVMVSRLRQKTEKDFIRTIAGQGFILGAEGRRQVQEAIAKAPADPVPIVPPERLPHIETLWSDEETWRLQNLLRDQTYTEAAMALGRTRNMIAGKARQMRVAGLR